VDRGFEEVQHTKKEGKAAVGRRRREGIETAGAMAGDDKKCATLKTLVRVLVNGARVGLSKERKR
jgi:hypothetical protein